MLNPSLQIAIDCHGNEISPEHHPFFWYEDAVYFKYNACLATCTSLYRNLDYLRAVNSDATLVPVQLSQPLCATPLLRLLEIARQCLHNNFISTVLTVIGGIISFHYESILQIQDECPLFLCFSRESGTGKSPTHTCICYSTDVIIIIAVFCHVHSVGKSTSLRVALSLYGVHNQHVHGPDSNAAAVMAKACSTTIPLGMLHDCTHLIIIKIMNCNYKRN